MNKRGPSTESWGTPCVLVSIIVRTFGLLDSFWTTQGLLTDYVLQMASHVS